MTTLPQTLPAGISRHRALALGMDYAELMKARVTSLVMMSAWCGYYLAAVHFGVPRLSWTMFHAVMGIGLVAGGTAAMNQVIERKIDVFMKRTARRPLPMGRMTTLHALLVGIVTIAGGLAYLALATNWMTALLTAATSATYLGAYTPLKRRSPVCTFIGAFPGAMPAVLGWAAVRPSLGWEPLVLFGIMFLWQFPHFHSIAWLYREDYERAGIRMLPVVEPDGASTARRIFWTSLALVPLSLMPSLFGLTGPIYLLGAQLAGFAFAFFCCRVLEECSRQRARQVLLASVIYLPVLYVFLVADRAIPA
jgi:protoheme IX farnesyltransferase